MTGPHHQPPGRRPARLPAPRALRAGRTRGRRPGEPQPRAGPEGERREPMKIARVAAGGEAVWAIVDGDTAYRLEGSPWERPQRGAPIGDLSTTRLLAPCQPTKIVCIGLNYRAHVAESGQEVPAEPLMFLKPPTRVVGRGRTWSGPRGRRRSTTRPSWRWCSRSRPRPSRRGRSRTTSWATPAPTTSPRGTSSGGTGSGRGRRGRTPSAPGPVDRDGRRSRRPAHLGQAQRGDDAGQPHLGPGLRGRLPDQPPDQVLHHGAGGRAHHRDAGRESGR